MTISFYNIANNDKMIKEANRKMTLEQRINRLERVLKNEDLDFEFATPEMIEKAKDLIRRRFNRDVKQSEEFYEPSSYLKWLIDELKKYGKTKARGLHEYFWITDCNGRNGNLSKSDYTIICNDDAAVKELGEFVIDLFNMAIEKFKKRNKGVMPDPDLPTDYNSKELLRAVESWWYEQGWDTKGDFNTKKEWMSALRMIRRMDDDFTIDACNDHVADEMGVDPNATRDETREILSRLAKNEIDLATH